ncbi:MAG: GAF domain-containing protein [Bacteroidales bacterium]|nr:GAF domain-containing protein [Bacteroidales bacterium]
MRYNVYKYILFGALAIVIVTSFFLANLLIGLLSTNTVSFSAIGAVVIILGVIFLMFYILFQFLQSLSDKDKIIEKLSDELNRLKTPQIEEEQVQTVSFNPAELAQKIIPSTPQSLSVQDFCEKILMGIANSCQIVSGIFYVKDTQTNTFYPCGKYAYYSTEPIEVVTEGEGIVGQVIKDKKPAAFDRIPANYLRVVSGLGQGSPRYLYIFPILNKDEVVAAVELAAFVPFDDKQKQVLEQLSLIIGKIILKLKQ